MTMSVCQEFMIYEGLRHVETFAMLLSTGLGTTFVVFLFLLISILLAKVYHAWL